MALCYRVSHCTQLVGDSGKMVLQARWLHDMARLSALGAKLGTVSMALYLQRNPLCATCGPDPRGSNIKIGFTYLAMIGQSVSVWICLLMGSTDLR